MNRVVSIGAPIFFAVVGAIVFFAINVNSHYANLHMIGLIVMIAGLVWLAWALYMNMRSTHTSVQSNTSVVDAANPANNVQTKHAVDTEQV